MQVIACDIAPQPDLALSLGFEYVTLDDLLRRSHIISLHATLTAESLHMINRETLARCMRGVVFINTARGALIDTHALLEAIESGVVAGAGLDVLEEERVLRQKATNVIGEQIIERMRAGLQSEESRMQNRHFRCLSVRPSGARSLPWQNRHPRHSSTKSRSWSSTATTSGHSAMRRICR